MFELILHLIRALQASDDPDPKVQNTWRRTIGLWATAVTLIGLFGLGWMRGWFVDQGLDRVATGSEITSIHRFEASSLRREFNRVMLDWCVAKQHSDAVAQLRAQTDLKSVQWQYRRLTGKEIKAPDCAEVLLIGALKPPPL